MEITDSQELQSLSILLQYPINCYCLLQIFEYYAPFTSAYSLTSYFTHQIELRIIILGFVNFPEESIGSYFAVQSCVAYSQRTLWSIESSPPKPLEVGHLSASFRIIVAWCIFGVSLRCCASVPQSGYSDPSVPLSSQEFHCNPSFKLPCSQSTPWMPFRFQVSARWLDTSWLCLSFTGGWDHLYLQSLPTILIGFVQCFAVSVPFLRILLAVMRKCFLQIRSEYLTCQGSNQLATSFDFLVKTLLFRLFQQWLTELLVFIVPGYSFVHQAFQWADSTQQVSIEFLRRHPHGDFPSAIARLNTYL